MCSSVVSSVSANQETMLMSCIDNRETHIIKPMRSKSKAKTDNVLGIKHRDLVSYTYKSGETHTGYVTALYPEQLALNFQSKTKHCKKVNARKCRLLWKFNKIYWLEQCV